ncbi:MAG: hypothetical protein WCO56_11600 [Verrucomicrobiota bacterium]
MKNIFRGKRPVKWGWNVEKIENKLLLKKNHAKEIGAGSQELELGTSGRKYVLFEKNTCLGPNNTDLTIRNTLTHSKLSKNSASDLKNRQTSSFFNFNGRH